MSYVGLKRSKRWYAICTLSNLSNGLRNSQKYWVNSGNLYAGADLDRNVRPSVGRKATIELFEAASNFSSVEFKPSTMPEQERRSHGFEVFFCIRKLSRVEVFEFAFVYYCVLNRFVFSTCRWSWRRRERKDVPSLLLNPRVGKWPVWRRDLRSIALIFVLFVLIFLCCWHVFALAAHSLRQSRLNCVSCWWRWRWQLIIVFLTLTTRWYPATTKHLVNHLTLFFSPTYQSCRPPLSPCPMGLNKQKTLAYFHMTNKNSKAMTESQRVLHQICGTS